MVSVATMDTAELIHGLLQIYAPKVGQFLPGQIGLLFLEPPYRQAIFIYTLEITIQIAAILRSVGKKEVLSDFIGQAKRIIILSLLVPALTKYKAPPPARTASQFVALPAQPQCLNAMELNMTLILTSAMERFMKMHLAAANYLILKNKYAMELQYLQNAEKMNPTILQRNSVPVAEFLQNMATTLTSH